MSTTPGTRLHSGDERRLGAEVFLVLALSVGLALGSVAPSAGHTCIGETATVTIILDPLAVPCPDDVVKWNDLDNSSRNVVSSGGEIGVLSPGGANNNARGLLFYKNSCDGGRWQLSEADGIGAPGWTAWVPDGWRYFDSAVHSGYAETYEVEAICGHPDRLELTYLERAKYTQNYAFDDAMTRTPETSDWINVGSQISVTAPAISGYICTGWINGETTFPATGGSPGNCTFVGNLQSDDGSAVNQLTWNYKKAWNFQTLVREEGTSNPGPGDAALIGPFTDQNVRLTQNGSITADAHATRDVSAIPTGNSRWLLKGSVGTGSLGDDATGQSSRTFNLQSDTTLAWQYEKQHKVTVALDPLVPQSVRDAATPSPAVGDNWIKDGTLTTFSVNPAIVDPATGNTYQCTGWTNGSGNFAASGTSCNFSMAITQRSTITWTFARGHNINVSVEGVDLSPLPVASFDPDPGDNFFLFGSLRTLSADNVIFSLDNRFRYVLERWVGTGNVPLAGTASTTGPQTTVPPFTLNANSSVRWIYRKEARLKVAVVGLAAESALADAVECLTTDLNNCVNQAGTQPRPPWIVPSSNAARANYYPIGTQLAVAAKHQVTTAAQEVKTAVGINVLSGTLVNSSGQQLVSPRKAEAFTLDGPVEIEWDYSDTTRYEVGVAIPRPVGANDQMPMIDIVLPTGVMAGDAFFWSPHTKMLYPQRPASSVRLTWFDAGNSPMPPAEALVAWPVGRQLHVAQAPANLAPPTTTLVVDDVAYTENAAVVDGALRFQANLPGMSVLRFLDGGIDENSFPPEFVVVETVTWDGAPSLVLNRPCDIGTTLAEPATTHSDPEGKNGYVFNSLSFYDGFGPKKAHDRTQRLGPIIPVNRVELSDAIRHMLVIWYQTDPHQIGWPVNPIKYNCQWPAAPEKIVIASGQGFKSSPGFFPEGEIYRQDDPAQPGFNRNEEHALFIADTVWALRRDFNSAASGSDPYVLLKYRDVSGDWAMMVFGIDITSPEFPDFTIDDVDYMTAGLKAVLAGQKINPFPPLTLLPPSDRSAMGTGATWYHRDHNDGHWAKAADWQLETAGSGTSEIGMAWYYPLQEGFYYPDFDGDSEPDAVVGDAIPFLGHDGGGSIAPVLPQIVTYKTVWPALAPRLRLGETLITGKPGLPDLLNMASTRVIFDEAMYAGTGHLVKLFDPVSERRVTRTSIPTTIETENQNGNVFFKELPFYLKNRLFYDPFAQQLVFRGVLEVPPAGEPLVLLNVMSLPEKDVLVGLLPSLSVEIGQLFDLSRNPNGVNFAGAASLENPFNATKTHTPLEWTDDIWGLPLGIVQALPDKNPISATLFGVPSALTAGTAAGTGFVTVVENDDARLGSAPVALHVIEVVKDVYAGEIKVIPSDNVFDEKLTLRHNVDFGGEPERFVIEWYYRPDEAGISPPLPMGNDKTGWLFLGRGVGMSEVTIEGADVRTLSDNWIVTRYYYKDVFPDPPVVLPGVTPAENDPDNWSPWAGAPGNQQAMLAEGWLKRVVDQLNPLDARVKDFQRSPTNTLVSMISQAGTWCGSDIALSSTPENLNSIGIISAYQTLLKRARSLSIESGQDYGPANTALLNMATRVSDLYMLLANEAYADAIDPTIGFTTASGEFGSLAPSIFAFQNQLDSLLEEELVLLRGRDDTAGTTRVCPVYNRPFWNFTNGDGEVAYVQTYSITDQDFSGVVDETDAQMMFPQSHGDAWGHYLSAMKPWYRLLGNPNYTWEPRAESVLVAGVPVLVDYLDERKFARAAAAKAQAGVEILDLTYRSAYVDDSNGQWQGYKDTDPERAWGVDEWARRVGHGAYLDWVLANAMLPTEDLNPEHTGIRKIDRITVSEVNAIAGHFHNAQGKLDKADGGLNPLGLAKGVVPFDIDPTFLDVASGVQGLTHFEQIYERALKAVQNTNVVFDYANEFTNSLRRSSDSLDNFKRDLRGQERDFLNRAIEIFGYPYSDDIGVGKTYPEGFDGPDTQHFMMVERSVLTGEPPTPQRTFTATYDFAPNAVDPALGIMEGTLSVNYPVATDGPWIVKPLSWTGSRRATGEIQDALSEFMQAESAFQRSIKELDIAFQNTDTARQLLKQKYDVDQANILVMESVNAQVTSFEAAIAEKNRTIVGLRRTSDSIERAVTTIIESLPKVVGFSSDVTAPIRAGLAMTKNMVSVPLLIAADAIEQQIMDTEHAQAAVERNGDVTMFVNDSRYEVQQLVQELGTQFNNQIVAQYETFTRREAMMQALGRYTAAVAEGERLLSHRESTRKNAAADIQDYRYNDIAFRIFRNDALQKYRAQFDLASRYVYLAAVAYDYETNLLGTEGGSGREFLTQIFRERTLGKIVNDQPVAGLGGLADVLARLGENFAVYKSQLGFNNPQTETNRFSLRTENFRLKGDASSNPAWKAELEAHVVPNLWDVPEFKRYAKPFTTEDQGEQPAIVIPFSTTVTFGKNFFGWPLSGGDSAYDPTNFATKVRSVGVWFEGYPLADLSQTPRVYLIPVGADVLRAPGGDGSETREWNIVDQVLPAPFTLGASDMANEEWIPMNDSLSGDIGTIRRFPSLRAYKYSEPFDDAETTSNSRIIGRSVWNTEWLLIIPGGTLLFDPDAGLETFFDTVTDVKLFFQTYAYSGI